MKDPRLCPQRSEGHHQEGISKGQCNFCARPIPQKKQVVRYLATLETAKVLVKVCLLGRDWDNLSPEGQDAWLDKTDRVLNTYRLTTTEQEALLDG